eukprot:UN02859
MNPLIGLHRQLNWLIHPHRSCQQFVPQVVFQNQQNEYSLKVFAYRDITLSCTKPDKSLSLTTRQVMVISSK